jgi:hypothetical protein
MKMTQVLINLSEVKVGDVCEFAFTAPMEAPHYGKSVETVKVESVERVLCDVGIFAALGIEGLVINGRDVWQHGGYFMADRA